MLATISFCFLFLLTWKEVTCNYDHPMEIQTLRLWLLPFDADSEEESYLSFSGIKIALQFRNLKSGFFFFIGIVYLFWVV